MLKIITTGINAGCYSATFTEYKTINELLQAVGVRSRLVSMTGNDVVFQAEPAVLVTHEGGDVWKIETPEQDTYYYSFRDLMIDINANLDAVRELVECGQIERELWEEAWKA